MELFLMDDFAEPDDDGEEVEIRLRIPRWASNVFDAKVMARGGSTVFPREKLLRPTIVDLAKLFIREATMVGNAMKGNGAPSATHRQAPASLVRNETSEEEIARLLHRVEQLRKRA